MVLLIVDDQPMMVDLWEKYFQPMARDVRKAYNIDEAHRLMRVVPHPDLVLLDLKLTPEGNPRDTLNDIRQFKDVNPDVIVFVVTGHPDPELPTIAQLKGADGFADKLDVATQEQLLSAVLTIMRNSPVPSGEHSYERKLSLIERLTTILTKPDEQPAPSL